MTKIDDFHQAEHTSLLLRNVWREAFELWFAEDTQDVYVSPFLCPMEVRQVIVQQSAIGWRQVFNGRSETAWATL